jgi:hypothetical protein
MKHFQSIPNERSPPPTLPPPSWPAHGAIAFKDVTMGECSILLNIALTLLFCSHCHALIRKRFFTLPFLSNLNHNDRLPSRT